MATVVNVVGRANKQMNRRQGNEGNYMPLLAFVGNKTVWLRLLGKKTNK